MFGDTTLAWSGGPQSRIFIPLWVVPRQVDQGSPLSFQTLPHSVPAKSTPATSSSPQRHPAIFDGSHPLPSRPSLAHPSLPALPLSKKRLVARQATSIKFWVHTNFGELNVNIILPLLTICRNLYYACPKQSKYLRMTLFMVCQKYP